MARVKVPEFKIGETVTAEKFNEAFDQFKRGNLLLDGDNFADQAFGFDQIPKDISLTDRSKFSLSRVSFRSQSLVGGTPPSQNPWNYGETYTQKRRSNLNHPNDNLITLKNLSGGDQFIIRASCVIDTIDGGWRTYMFGIPPIVKIGLVRFSNQTRVDFGGETSNANTFLINETEAHYRIAFTGKVPSASSYFNDASVAGFRDRTLDDVDHTHRDTRLVAGDEVTEEYGTIRENPYMPFDGFHSYSTCFLYTHKASDPNVQSFGIMCGEEGGKVGYNPDGSGSGIHPEGGPSGCKDPSHQSYHIRNFELYAYQVKK